MAIDTALAESVLTAAEVAEVLHSTPAWVYELRKRGVLRAIPHTNRPVLFARRTIEEFIAAIEPAQEAS
ncbi:MAG TPA: helix-turn-helix domain-containing protein [Acidimicrobiales bacterium]|nr:helix-turn-helix domain-containing protein [Acidimicrobiales bacterium]